MSSREKILAAVRASQPAPTTLPPVPSFEGDASAQRFTAAVQGVGGQVIALPDLSHLAETTAILGHGSRVASTLVPATVAVHPALPLADLATIDLAILRGELGVAENGAVWLPEAAMLHRALPTITQHLVLVLARQQLVATMHQAYAHLGNGVGGYGVFLAGPSKTADIEQSLVIGAHGARSLTVLLIG